MLGPAGAWFAALSTAGKVGVVSGAVVATSVAGAAISDPQPTQPTKPACTSSKTTTTEPKEIPFEKTTVEDPNMPKGQTSIKTAGVKGVKTLTYEEVTFKPNNCEDDQKNLVKEEVTTQPVTEVTAVGTYVAPAAPPKPTSNCDPNYSGGCVPIASDVDCGGGSGNGPAYFYGTATVVGSDIYGLDRDGDGLACE